MQKDVEQNITEYRCYVRSLFTLKTITLLFSHLHHAEVNGFWQAMQTWVYGTWDPGNLLIFKPRNLQLCMGFVGLILKPLHIEKH